MTIKVGIVGYGTIGKRVADAVELQKDMELVGVSGHSYSFKMDVAADKGYSVFSDNPEAFTAQGIEISGALLDLVNSSDVIVDCSPKPFGKENRDKLYKPNRVKAIFQGGEKNDVGEASFNAQSNYSDAVGKDYVRVVSCNTTGLSRSIHALHAAYGVKEARASLVRRGTDPSNIRRGPINAIVPSLELPSHHGPDVRSVLPDVEVFSTAMIVPTTLMHLHTLQVKLKKEVVSSSDILEAFRKTTRVRIIKTESKISSTAGIMELAKDIGNPRGDMMDLCIWDQGIGIHKDWVFLQQAVHQESIVVPENIDAIRALMGETDALSSIKKTNKSLNLSNPETFLY